MDEDIVIFFLSFSFFISSPIFLQTMNISKILLVNYTMFNDGSMQSRDVRFKNMYLINS